MKSKQTKQTEAVERNKARNKRSNSEQVSLLDSRPGNSKRERARLS